MPALPYPKPLIKQLIYKQGASNPRQERKLAGEKRGLILKHFQMNTSTTLTSIGDAVTVKAISEWEGSKRMDTKIMINDILLCYVCGEDYQAFMDKLQNLVNTYRI